MHGIRLEGAIVSGASGGDDFRGVSLGAIQVPEEQAHNSFC